jgi:hypothetical protein
MGKSLMTRAVCTIVSLNYLPYARSLYESFREIHSDWKFYVLIADRLPANMPPLEEQFEFFFVEELRIPNFSSMAFKYDVLAFNTNVKPTFLRFLLDRGVQQLIYLDPDIFVYSPLTPIFDSLDEYSIVITPHCTSPNEACREAEIRLLQTGTYNLGFIAISDNPETRRFLNWWEERCLHAAFDEIRSGLFVDQKWINQVPAYFEDVKILRHSGCNVAYWNLHEHVIRQEGNNWFVDEQPLIFFHFSGVHVDGGDRISKHTDQFNLVNRPELKKLFQDYRNCLISHGIREAVRSSYAFGSFDNGQRINRLTRALYASNLERFGHENPFNSSSAFYQWAKQSHILDSKETADSYTSANYSKSDRRLKVIHFLLRGTLRLVGADNYTMLMKYVSYISILRNQKEVFAE